MKLIEPIAVQTVFVCVVFVCLAFTLSASGFDTHFNSGKSALAIPFELDAGSRIYLQVSVEGSKPLSFVLDTGASHTILSLRNAQAFELGIEPLETVTGGIGAYPPQVYVTSDNVTYSLSGVLISNQPLVVFSLDKAEGCLSETAENGKEPSDSLSRSAKEGTGKTIDGVLGRDFFANFVVEIDYPARLINLYEPQSYKYPGRGKSLRLEIDPQYIFVRAKVKAAGRKPVAARLVVDTGSGTALSLNRQFAEANKLLPQSEKLTEGVECGVGGFSTERSWSGTLEAISLGRFDVINPITAFYQKTAERNYDGLLGNPALQNFKVIFDYSRRRMILEPSVKLVETSAPYDRGHVVVPSDVPDNALARLDAR